MAKKKSIKAQDSQKISPQQRPKPAGGIQAETLPGGVIIYQTDGDRILQLNESSALIWGLCTGEHTVAEITAILQALFPSEETQIAQDVQENLQSFVDFKLITWA
jgi:hypothetical protein